jgi:hypothetical protein
MDIGILPPVEGGVNAQQNHAVTLEAEQATAPERRPITHDELRLLAAAALVVWPPLRTLPPGALLEGWRQLAEKHRIFVEHRRPSKKGGAQ